MEFKHLENVRTKGVLILFLQHVPGEQDLHGVIASQPYSNTKVKTSSSMGYNLIGTHLFIQVFLQVEPLILIDVI